MLRLYNTLSRQVEEFKPIKAGEATLYTCGPTVYDNLQLGNWRSFIFDDTLRRALEINSYKVRHVMNITDVGHLVSDDDEGEDKLEKGAKREGKTVWEVAQSYTAAFKVGAKKLNILPPNTHEGKDDNYARATDFITQQIEMVKILIDKNFAYQTGQAIYFDVSKLPSYGELTGQKLSDKEVAARAEVVSDSNKRHPQDFALWFFLVGRFAEHEMHWDSPWGAGFPGWHLECSAIIHATLGEPLDIHTGGVDHIGTHHTNEMAQTEAAYDHKLANYWIHNEFLLVDSQRMGKSLGNFYTLDDIVKKGFKPLALRLLFLQAHYRTQMNFTWDSLSAAAQNLQELEAWADLIWQQAVQPISAEDKEVLKTSIKTSVSDDLNSATALAAINKVIGQASPDKQLLEFIDDVLGLSLSQRGDITHGIKDLINRREAARDSKDWDIADELRQKLTAEGVEINDTQIGPVWSRV